MTWLALDIGKKRTGVALSESGIIATPWGVVTGSPDEQFAAIFGLMERYHVTTLICGRIRPSQHQSDTVELLSQIETGIARLTPSPKLVMVDETLSTKEAERITRSSRLPEKMSTDAIAATLLLEDFLAGPKEFED